MIRHWFCSRKKHWFLLKFTIVILLLYPPQSLFVEGILLSVRPSVTFCFFICMKEFGSEKKIFDKMTAVRTSPTTAFDGAIRYFAYTM